MYETIFMLYIEHFCYYGISSCLNVDDVIGGHKVTAITCDYNLSEQAVKS